MAMIPAKDQGLPRQVGLLHQHCELRDTFVRRRDEKQFGTGCGLRKRFPDDGYRLEAHVKG